MPNNQGPLSYMFNSDKSPTMPTMSNSAIGVSTNAGSLARTAFEYADGIEKLAIKLKFNFSKPPSKSLSFPQKFQVPNIVGSARKTGTIGATGAMNTIDLPQIKLPELSDTDKMVKRWTDRNPDVDINASTTTPKPNTSTTIPKKFDPLDPSGNIFNKQTWKNLFNSIEPGKGQGPAFARSLVKDFVLKPFGILPGVRSTAKFIDDRVRIGLAKKQREAEQLGVEYKPNLTVPQYSNRLNNWLDETKQKSVPSKAWSYFSPYIMGVGAGGSIYGMKFYQDYKNAQMAENLKELRGTITENEERNIKPVGQHDGKINSNKKNEQGSTLSDEQLKELKELINSR